MSSVAERSAIITLRGVKLIESSQSALTLSVPSTSDAPSIRQMAEGRRILFGDSTIAAWANLSTGCR